MVGGIPWEAPCLALVGWSSPRRHDFSARRRTRSTFLNGYGHFDEVENDIAVSKDHGVNAALEISGSVRSGKASLAIRNTAESGNGTLAHPVIVEPGRSYDVSLWAKSDDAAGLSITATGTDEGAVGRRWVYRAQNVSS